MKRFVADTLKRTARLCIRWANWLDGPKITYYDRQWDDITEAMVERLVRAGQAESKGAARRKLGVNPPAPFGDLTTGWLGRVMAGTAPGVPPMPKLPNAAGED